VVVLAPKLQGETLGLVLLALYAIRSLQKIDGEIMAGFSVLVGASVVLTSHVSNLLVHDTTVRRIPSPGYALRMMERCLRTLLTSVEGIIMVVTDEF
jgi:hypothetical protein